MREHAYKMPRFIREPSAEYHGKSRQYFTSHQLLAYQACPLALKLSRGGMLPNVIPDFYREGAALHCLALEGRKRFEESYIVGGPINEKTGKTFGEDTKAYAEWEAQQNRPVVSEAQYALCCHMAAAIAAHAEAAAILQEGTPEGVLRATYAGIASQIRCDWFNPARGLADLKTCDDLADFYPGDVEALGYVGQMAFYREIIRLETGEVVPVYLIGVEKKPPYRCGVWKISARRLDKAERENFCAMLDVARSLADDFWPTRFETLRGIE